MSKKFSANKKVKPRRIKRKRTTRIRIAIFSFFAVLLIILVASYFSQPSSPPKKPARLYFHVDPWGLLGEPRSEVTWLVSEIWFNITPVGGDANNLIIESWAMGEPQEFGDIKQNQTVFVYLKAASPYETSTTSDGRIPVEISVKCDETDENDRKITILFRPPQT